jgi:long-chain acyl-CoA synthetase
LTTTSNRSFNNWPKGVPKNISYPSVPLQEILCKSALRCPEKTVIIFGKQEITYAQLEVLSNQFANALLDLGVKKGDCIAVFLPNIPQFLIVYFGALKAGAVVTAVTPLYREREVEYQLADSGAKSVVAIESVYPIIETVGRKTAVENVILTGAECFAPHKTFAGAHSFGQLIEGASAKRLNVQIDPAEDLALLQYTGGTTGTPKAAMLTHRNLVSNALSFAAWIKGKHQDIFLTVLPLFHIYGMTTSMTVPINLGATMVLLPKFEPATVAQAIERHRVTVFCGVPNMYQALLAKPELAKNDLTSIRVCISGAASLPPQVQKRFMEVTGGLLAEGYGLTEASPVTHCNPVDVSLVKMGSIGLPLPDTEARIVNPETGEPLESGRTGELAIRGPQVMKGYWRRPEETAAVVCDGWLLTGDIARIDSDGYFYIVDRKKDLIKTRGYSVYPHELEAILYEHPAVKVCAVVGKIDERAGEIPKAYVVLKEDKIASAEQLMAFVNEKVAAYKAIHEVEFRQELPTSSAGKVLRRQL